jgi:primary-amine oxidase
LLGALAKRSIEPGDGLCLSRTTGRFFDELVDPVHDRLLRLDCFYIKGQGGIGILPSTAAFARPIEGLSVLYDLEKQAIAEITDSYPNGGYPPHDIAALEYHEGALETRAPLRPVTASRPQGVNFTVTDGRVDWQGWQFHLRFDPRQGTVLNRVGHLTPEGFRSVAYEIAMSEMFVPYYDTDAHWFYRAYFDMGEYGLGNMATELKGSDCPSHAEFQNAVLHSADGTPKDVPNRICIFEHDPGYPIWRHHESLYDGVPGMENHQSRSATELVVRMVATIGNYDYFQDYVFAQDGRMRVRLVATGIDATKGVMAASMADPSAEADTATGTLIAPHLVGVNHDHFFGYRIDMDVDGQNNNFQRHKLRAVPQPVDAPRQGIWAVTTETVTSELAAQTQMDVSKPALLVFASADQTNAMGYPTGYQIIMPNVRPLVTLEDATHERALFVRNNLWVTRFKREELFSAGLMVNQSAPGMGLPQFVADDETITNTDVVAWPTIGFHHVPMAEDWPVMPAKVDEIILKPRNFFDRNPAIDLPN